jgi:MYXO-CTERM domain-containing protein
VDAGAGDVHGAAPRPRSRRPEVEAIDEAGLATYQRGDQLRAVPFHGAAGEDGCGCTTSDGGDAGGLIALVGLAWLGLRRRRRSRVLAALLFVALAGTLPACNCGGSPPCGDVDCLPGEVERGAVGRWNGVASDGDRTVVSTYDLKLGDLVVVDVTGELVYTAVDGVPDETPTYHPSGYRGGVATPGPDVGAWTSIALVEGRARASYQDLDAGALKYATGTIATGPRRWSRTTPTRT